MILIGRIACYHEIFIAILIIEKQLKFLFQNFVILVNKVTSILLMRGQIKVCAKIWPKFFQVLFMENF